MDRKVKAAVIGCGQISNIYIKNLKGMFRIIDLIALCDLNSAFAEEKAALYGVSQVMTIDEIAESEEIELVVVLTGAFAHYEVIKRMLEAGKHVWTEKTFTATLEQSRELVQIADERGLLIGVAPDSLLGAGIQTALGALRNGMIGSVSSGLVVINRNQNLNSERFRFLQRDGGSLPYDQGIYYIAVLLALLGPVKAIKAFGAPAPLHEPQMLYMYDENTKPWRIPGNNVLSATLEFECGALVSVLFDGNTIGAEQHNITLFGNRGIMKIGDPNTFNGEVKVVYAGQPECTLPFTHGYDGRSVLEPTPYDHYGHRGIGVAELAYSIRRGRKNRLNKEMALHCMEVLTGMDESAATGNMVTTVSRFEPLRPLTPGYYSGSYGTFSRLDAERSLMD